MIYINYNRLHKKKLNTNDFHVLQLLVQKENNLIPRKYDFGKLEDLGFIKQVKAGKSELEKLRVDKKGKAFMETLFLREVTDGTLELCDEIVEMFESYDVETGNKNKVLENLNWFLSKTEYSFEEIKESFEEWLGLDYKMWLENVLWDKKKASVFTTIKSRTIAQSPMYEFMRRKFEKEW